MKPTRKSWQKTLFRVMALAAALFGMSMPWSAHGFTVKDVTVVSRAPVGPRQLIWTDRKYAVLSDDGSKTVAVFSASGYGRKSGWILVFMFSTDIERPLEGDGSASPDGEKMLFACIDRFRSEVPSAGVEGVDLDARINGNYWAKFIGHMRAKMLQMSDPLDSTNLRRIDNRAQEFIRTSGELRGIAERIATRLGCKVRSVNLQGDGIAVKQGFFGQPMSAIVSQPELGMLINTAAISIFFEPK